MGKSYWLLVVVDVTMPARDPLSRRPTNVYPNNHGHDGQNRLGSRNKPVKVEFSNDARVLFFNKRSKGNVFAAAGARAYMYAYVYTRVRTRISRTLYTRYVPFSGSFKAWVHDALAGSELNHVSCNTPCSSNKLN